MPRTKRGKQLAAQCSNLGKRNATAARLLSMGEHQLVDYSPFLSQKSIPHLLNEDTLKRLADHTFAADNSIFNKFKYTPTCTTTVNASKGGRYWASSVGLQSDDLQAIEDCLQAIELTVRSKFPNSYFHKASLKPILGAKALTPNQAPHCDSALPMTVEKATDFARSPKHGSGTFVHTTCIAAMGQTETTIFISPYTLEEERQLLDEDVLEPNVTQRPMTKVIIPPFHAMLFWECRVHCGGAYEKDNVRLFLSFRSRLVESATKKENADDCDTPHPKRQRKKQEDTRTWPVPVNRLQWYKITDGFEL
jgi:hypothetical protein